MCPISLHYKNYLNSCIKTKTRTRIKYVSHIFYIRTCWFYYISSNIRHRYESKEPHSRGNLNVFSDRFSYICHFETASSISVWNVQCCFWPDSFTTRAGKAEDKQNTITYVCVSRVYMYVNMCLCIYVCMYVCLCV